MTRAESCIERKAFLGLLDTPFFAREWTTLRAGQFFPQTRQVFLTTLCRGGVYLKPRKNFKSCLFAGLRQLYWHYAARFGTSLPDTQGTLRISAEFFAPDSGHDRRLFVGKAKGFKTKSNLNVPKLMVAKHAPVGMLSACLCLAGNAGAQTAEQVKLGAAPEVGVAAMSGELTASKYVNDPGAPYENVFRNLDLGLSAGPKVGGGRVNVGLGPVALAPGLNTPVRRGFQPQDAELKIGFFYLNLTDITGSLLYSDNANLSNNNRRGDVTGAISLGTEAVLQLNDGLQFAISGRFVYLPFENRAGVDGFGISDPFAKFALNGSALFRAQMTYEFKIADWDAVIFDDFSINNQSLYRLGDGDFLDAYDGETFRSEKSFAGRTEVYRPGSYSPGGYRDDVNNPNRFDSSDLYYINQAGAEVSRLLPTVTRAIGRYVHQNVWYPNGNNRPGSAYDDYSADIFTARLQSERENLRFKPFLQHQASRYSNAPGWAHKSIAGVSGPITDQVDFLGQGGYYFRTGDNSSASSTIWLLALTHTAGPYTRHGVAYYREVTQPQRQLRESYNYQLQQILGPYLVGGFYASRDKYGDLDSKATFVEETFFSSYVSYDLGTRGNLSAQFYYVMTDYVSAAIPDSDRWIFRLLYNVNFTPDLRGTFLYQFQSRNSDVSAASYYENLLGVTITKSF